jgi:uncharacterized protein (TIGR01732 family)
MPYAAAGAVAGVGVGYPGYSSMAYILVLFILLVIILRVIGFGF